jgi:hypothetical protein
VIPPYFAADSHQQPQAVSPQAILRPSNGGQPGSAYSAHKHCPLEDRYRIRTVAFSLQLRGHLRRPVSAASQPGAALCGLEHRVLVLFTALDQLAFGQFYPVRSFCQLRGTRASYPTTRMTGRRDLAGCVAWQLHIRFAGSRKSHPSKDCVLRSSGGIGQRRDAVRAVP